MTRIAIISSVVLLSFAAVCHGVGKDEDPQPNFVWNDLVIPKGKFFFAGFDRGTGEAISLSGGIPETEQKSRPKSGVDVIETTFAGTESGSKGLVILVADDIETIARHVKVTGRRHSFKWGRRSFRDAGGDSGNAARTVPSGGARDDVDT